MDKIFKKIHNKKKGIDWYIKPHRDCLPGTIEAINEIIKDSQIRMIDPNISHYQLKKEKNRLCNHMSWICGT